MNQADGFSGGGVLIWAGLAVLVVAAVLFRKLFRKK